MNKNYILALLMITAIAGCREAATEKEAVISSAIKSETGISKIRLTDLENQDIDISQYNGKVVFVNFWATWCRPCISEMPSIQKLQARLKSENIIFLLASNEDVKEIEDFKHGNNYSLNFLHLVNMEELNIQVLPTTYIYNPGGKLVYSETGTRNWDDSAHIQMILKIINP